MIPLEDAKEEIKKNIEARHIKASARIIKGTSSIRGMLCLC
jgi:hypothetical protein